MRAEPLVSIIINNYNYARFLLEAIDSALKQTYPFIEVIVVDDGSTDNSHEAIYSYGSRIIPVLKSNAGQASSLNEGFSACKGEIICFLDADDLFHHEKVEKLVNLFLENNLINLPCILYNSLEVIDKEGQLIDSLSINNIFDWLSLLYTTGKNCLFNGEFDKVCTPDQIYAYASKYRVVWFIGMPTSCISISRAMADRIFPLPVVDLKISADLFLVKAASLMGSVYSTNLLLTQYRIHGNNAWYGSKNTWQTVARDSILPEEYLNSKLQEFGKEPVLSFLDSPWSSDYYRCQYGYNSGDHLIQLAFNVIRWRLDLETLIFFIKTYFKGIYLKHIRSHVIKDNHND
ncbi:MAG: glycosyltransferase [Scytolyngbya sp. HA4215-MV1]|jgi:glycosyltransferase involved in cell wall biosynthesis|nr:glycosyltransferase [Scytolyngbya sp. HA4215-MV1]